MINSNRPHLFKIIGCVPIHPWHRLVTKGTLLVVSVAALACCGCQDIPGRGWVDVWGRLADVPGNRHDVDILPLFQRIMGDTATTAFPEELYRADASTFFACDLMGKVCVLFSSRSDGVFEMYVVDLAKRTYFASTVPRGMVEMAAVSSGGEYIAVETWENDPDGGSHQFGSGSYQIYVFRNRDKAWTLIYESKHEPGFSGLTRHPWGSNSALFFSDGKDVLSYDVKDSTKKIRSPGYNVHAIDESTWICERGRRRGILAPPDAHCVVLVNQTGAELKEEQIAIDHVDNMSPDKRYLFAHMEYLRGYWGIASIDSEGACYDLESKRSLKCRRDISQSDCLFFDSLGVFK